MAASKLDPKDPDDIVDYGVDWSPYLTRIGDTIETSSWPVVTPTGITIQSHSNTPTTLHLPPYSPLEESLEPATN